MAFSFISRATSPGRQHTLTDDDVYSVFYIFSCRMLPLVNNTWKAADQKSICPQIMTIITFYEMKLSGQKWRTKNMLCFLVFTARYVILIYSWESGTSGLPLQLQGINQVDIIFH